MGYAGVVSAPTVVLIADEPAISDVLGTAGYGRNMLSMIGADGEARVYGSNMPANMRPDPGEEAHWFEITDDDNLLTRNTPVMIDAPVMWVYVDLTSAEGGLSVIHVGGAG